jgi:hypothetical protein
VNTRRPVTACHEQVRKAVLVRIDNRDLRGRLTGGLVCSREKRTEPVAPPKAEGVLLVVGDQNVQTAISGEVSNRDVDLLDRQRCAEHHGLSCSSSRGKQKTGVPRGVRHCEIKHRVLVEVSGRHRAAVHLAGPIVYVGLGKRTRGRLSIDGQVAVRFGGDQVEPSVAVDVNNDSELGEYVRAAINQALWNAKNLLDDYIHDSIPPGPQPFRLPSVVLFASSVLRLGAGVQLKQADGNFASSANTGVAETSVGAGAQVGDIWSRAKVTLAEGTHVTGSVRSCDVVEEQNNVVVTGETKEHIFIDAPVLSLEVAFPGWSSGDISIVINSDAGLDAGCSYGNVVVNSGATFRLSTGVYYFQAFTLDSGARLLLGGPVTIFVSGSIVFRGSVQTPSGARPQIAIGYTGTAMVSFESRFDGVMVAPYAKVNLESVAAPGYSGAFLAKEIEVAQGTVVTIPTEPPTGIPYDPPQSPPPQPIIDTPTGFQLTPGDKKVTLTWNPVAGATGYNIYYGTSPGLTTASAHVQIAASSHEQTHLTNGARYYYRVSAVGAAGESPLSVELSVVPQIPVPAIPQNVSATAGNTTVTVAWSSVPAATSYNIYWATAPGVTKNSNKLENKTSPFMHAGRSNGVT